MSANSQTLPASAPVTGTCRRPLLHKPPGGAGWLRGQLYGNTRPSFSGDDFVYLNDRDAPMEAKPHGPRSWQNQCSRLLMTTSLSGVSGF
jgi:hypothetical protein